MKRKTMMNGGVFSWLERCQLEAHNKEFKRRIASTFRPTSEVLSINIGKSKFFAVSKGNKNFIAIVAYSKREGGGGVGGRRFMNSFAAFSYK